jgi:hypothetical protein
VRLAAFEQAVRLAGGLHAHGSVLPQPEPPRANMDVVSSDA